ncbi:MAG: DNA polymerase III subunit gamma/tau [Planctomycetota bacterium]|nr:DNA polymerase III subunit gamma/tau [Planctomycetota bacterium]
MSYLVLARKYRPRDFDSVVGQKDLTEVLRGAIRDDRVGHAYLFCGPRGTGKTTTARIFAKALNCVEGPTPNPCGVCERCVAADEGHEVDIIEIDAASHTGVDYVRELREQAAYAPMAARHKIYLIDEVHMLSKSAFNALLKTLEEPPPHVKFLFATTEPQKLLDTVLSRCQILRLSPISETDIAGRLDFVMQAEGFTPEPGVSREVARLARGGMRDALSMTDQLIALAGTSPKVEDVARLGGEGGLAELDLLLTAVEDNDRSAVMSLLPSREGGEGEYLGHLLNHLRHTLVVALCGADAPMLEAGEEERVVLVARAKRLGADRLQIWLEELLAARERMRQLPSQSRLVLEVALLDLARPGGDWPLAELEARLVAMEGRLAAGGGEVAPRPPASGGAAPQQRPAQDAAPRRPSMLRPDTSPGAAPVRQAPDQPPPQATQHQHPEPDPPGIPGPGGRPTDPAIHWRAALDSLAGRQGEVQRLLARGARLTRLEGGRALVTTRPLGDADRKLLEAPRVQTAIARALAEAIGHDIELQIEFGRVPTKADLPKPDPFTEKVAETFGGLVEREHD